MSFPGLVRDKNLSDLGDSNAAWTNLAEAVGYSYSANRANFVNNSSVIRQDDKSNVIIAQASGIALSYGNQYVYRITEQSGTPIPFTFGYVRAAETSSSYTNLDWRLNISNGPVVGSILLKAGSHNYVGMALRPAKGGTFFRDTNYPVLGIDLLTGEVQDVFGNGKPYEIMGAMEESNGWWRVSMSSICQQAYAVAAVDLLFLDKVGNFFTLPSASSTDGSKFFYAALPQIEPGHEPSTIIITTGEQPIYQQTTASSTSGISFTGNDIAAIKGLNGVGNENILRASSLLSPAQPRITVAQSSGATLQAAANVRLSLSSPLSSGNYFLNGLIASGFSINGNALNSISGNPFSGSTALCPIVLQALIPQSLKVNTTFASGALANPTIAIPIEYNDFYVMMVAGQS